ncbi:hypothetical protein [Paenibacillus harenae]|uniref:Uncharacterized protein n=1 Tax=Paenibacillus harenae TaxID=306543 RepID=A0ABT9U8Z8_PAEHA|nr:hypothetical protein [Paenibacillus harenae]MDQ0116101.1 hypothetical protein [Paenibacillus harenae]
MDNLNQEQKQLRLKQFLKRLSEDPSMANQNMARYWGSLAELLVLTGYNPRNEPIDMAELVSLLLKRNEIEACSEDMMQHVLNGGTVDDFMKMGRSKAI